MKKEYEQPTIEIIQLTVEDIITASGTVSKSFGKDDFDEEDSWDNLFK